MVTLHRAINGSADCLYFAGDCFLLLLFLCWPGEVRTGLALDRKLISSLLRLKISVRDKAFRSYKQL